MLIGIQIGWSKLQGLVQMEQIEARIQEFWKIMHRIKPDINLKIENHINQHIPSLEHLQSHLIIHQPIGEGQQLTVGLLAALEVLAHIKGVQQIEAPAHIKGVALLVKAGVIQHHQDRHNQGVVLHIVLLHHRDRQ